VGRWVPFVPNVWVGHDGYLHIISRKTPYGGYTSATIQTKKLKSFQYGRIEARIKIPAGKGMWPAFWMLGDNISTVSWPKCGELDILENLGREPSRVYGSIHGPGSGTAGHGKTIDLPNGRALADDFHIYGMIWSPKKVQYYLDSPTNIYATFTPADLNPGEGWPFDDGRYFFIINNAIGGAWGGNPDDSTKFPTEMLVDYVRVYQSEITNPAGTGK
jgi:beta-glucanase (GH16 family)